MPPMICPNCKCEYIRGVTHCADCDAALVDVLDSAPTDSDSLVMPGIVSVWEGVDQAQIAAVQQALDTAGIQFVTHASTTATGRSSIWGAALRNKHEIFVQRADEERARRALESLPLTINLDDLSPEEIASLEIPAAEDVGSETQVLIPDDIPEDEDVDGELSEVWNGENEELAGALSACLRENGIAARRVSDATHWRLLVRPETESRAKEIVREVVEATPPE